MHDIEEDRPVLTLPPINMTQVLYLKDVLFAQDVDEFQKREGDGEQGEEVSLQAWTKRELDALDLRDAEKQEEKFRELKWAIDMGAPKEQTDKMRRMIEDISIQRKLISKSRKKIYEMEDMGRNEKTGGEGDEG